MTRHTVAIPVAVARAVKQSIWFAAQKNDADTDPSTAQAIADFESAALGGWRRNVLVHSSAHAQAMVDGVSATVNELRMPGKRETALQRDLIACATQMQRTVESMRAQENTEAARQTAEEAARLEKLQEEGRRLSIESWEKPVATVIEAGLPSTRRLIADEFGLDRRDPRVRAALTAAFRVGARQAMAAANSLAYVNPHQYDPAEVATLHERNITMFAKARQRKNQESNIVDREQDQ